MADTNDRKIEELRQQATTTTQAAGPQSVSSSSKSRRRTDGFPAAVDGNAGDGGRGAVDEGRRLDTPNERCRPSYRGSDEGCLPAAAGRKANRFIDCMSGPTNPDMRATTGIRQRYIRVLTWLLGTFYHDTHVMHGNRHNNLFGLPSQVGRSNHDTFTVSGGMPIGPYDREFVPNKPTDTSIHDTIAMNGAWLKGESNPDTTAENCDWLDGPVQPRDARYERQPRDNRHHLGEHDVLGKASGDGAGDEGWCACFAGNSLDAPHASAARKEGSLPGLRRGLGSRHEADENTTSREKPGGQRGRSQVNDVWRCRYPRAPENPTWSSRGWYQGRRSSDFGQEWTVFACSDTPTASR